MFSFESFVVVILIFKLLVHFESTFLYGGKVSTSFFAWGYPVFPKLLLENLFSPFNGFGTLVKNHLTIYSRVYF